MCLKIAVQVAKSISEMIHTFALAFNKLLTKNEINTNDAGFAS
jgi:hypothetical protein